MNQTDKKVTSTFAAILQDPLGTKGFFLILLGFIAVIYPEVLLGSHTFFYRDFALFGYPNAHFLRESWLNGELPLWNSLNCCGMPFLAQWGTLGWYPLSLLFVAFPMPWAVGYFSLIHLLIGGLGMYRLAQGWTGSNTGAAFAGLAFALGGLTQNSLMLPNYMVALAWMPWVVWTVERGWREGSWKLVPAIVTGSLQMLSGVPEIILFTWLLLVPLLLAVLMRDPELRPRGMVRFIGICAGISGLCAVQLLPFLELLLNAHRTADYGQDHYPMPLWGWANYLVPLFKTTPSMNGVFSQVDQQFTSSYYVGIGTVFLSLVGVWRIRKGQARLLGVIALLAIVMALGSKGIVFEVARTLFPPLGMARFPAKFLFVPALLLPLLAAFTLGRWEDRRQKTSPRQSLHGNTLWGRVESYLLLGLLLAILVIGLFGWGAPEVGGDSTAIAVNAIGRGLLLLLFAGLLWMFSRRNPLPRWVTLCLVLLAGMDCWTHTPLQNPTVVTYAYQPGLELRTLTPEPGFRAQIAPRSNYLIDHLGMPDSLAYCMGLRSALFNNWNIVDGIPVTHGFFTLYSKHYQPIRERLTSPGPPPTALYDFLGASQISSEESLFGWKPRTNAMPLITGGQRPVFADDAIILEQLASTNFAPREVVYLPTELEPSFPPLQNTKVTIESWSQQQARLAATVNAEAPGLVVISQSWFPNWQAEVNGQSAPIYRANLAFQAIPVPAGHSEIRLVYRDRALLLGGIISLLSLGGLLAALGSWRHQVQVARRLQRIKQLADEAEEDSRQSEIS